MWSVFHTPTPAPKKSLTCAELYLKASLLNPQIPRTWLAHRQEAESSRSDSTADGGGGGRGDPSHLRRDARPAGPHLQPRAPWHGWLRLRMCFLLQPREIQCFFGPFPSKSILKALVFVPRRKVSLVQVISSLRELDIKFSFSIKTRCHQKMISRSHRQGTKSKYTSVYTHLWCEERGRTACVQV